MFHTTKTASATSVILFRMFQIFLPHTQVLETAACWQLFTWSYLVLKFAISKWHYIRKPDTVPQEGFFFFLLRFCCIVTAGVKKASLRFKRGVCTRSINGNHILVIVLDIMKSGKHMWNFNLKSRSTRLMVSTNSLFWWKRNHQTNQYYKLALCWHFKSTDRHHMPVK